MESSGRPPVDDDPMRIYQVFQNSFNKIANTSSSSPNTTTSAITTSASSDMDSNNQFGQFTTSASASGQASTVTSAVDTFGNSSTDSPYFPFGGHRTGTGTTRIVGKVEKTEVEATTAAQWYGEEFVQGSASSSTRLPSYQQQTGTGNPQDSYFGLQPEHHGSEWQAYGAYSQFGAAPSTTAAAVAVAGHLDTMLYGGPAPGDPASGPTNYGSTPGGTPPVASPAPYSAAAAAAGAPGGGRGHGGLNR